MENDIFWCEIGSGLETPTKKLLEYSPGIWYKEMSSPDTHVSISFMRFISFWNHLIFLWRRHSREKEKTLGHPAQYASNNSAQYWPILERLGVGLGRCCIELCIELHRWNVSGKKVWSNLLSNLKQSLRKKKNNNKNKNAYLPFITKCRGILTRKPLIVLFLKRPVSKKLCVHKNTLRTT